MATGDWGYIPGPVSPMDVSRSIRELNAVYQSSNDAWHQQSARLDAARQRWSTAFRGDWYYANPYTGHVVTMPYTTDSYTADPHNYGDLSSGYTPGGENYLQVDDFGG